jgi:hypothetical protein
LTRQTESGSSQISRPDGSVSRYGCGGTGRMRFGMRGESYWLESYSKPRSQSASYAQIVSRLIENAGAR